MMEGESPPRVTLTTPPSPPFPPSPPTAQNWLGTDDTKRDVVARVGDPPPHTGNVFRVSLFWLGREPFTLAGRVLIF